MSLKRFLDPAHPVIKMKASDTVMEAVQNMAGAKTGAVLIMRDDKALEGIFTERDLLIRVTSAGLNPKKTLLGDVMTTDVVVLSLYSNLDHAINVMSKDSIRHLPVEDKNHDIIGMISLRHLLHEKIDLVVQELNVLEEFDDDVPGG